MTHAFIHQLNCRPPIAATSILTELNSKRLYKPCAFL